MVRITRLRKAEDMSLTQHYRRCCFPVINEPVDDHSQLIHGSARSPYPESPSIWRPTSRIIIYIVSSQPLSHSLVIFMPDIKALRMGYDKALTFMPPGPTYTAVRKLYHQLLIRDSARHFWTAIEVEAKSCAMRLVTKANPDRPAEIRL